MRLKVTTNRYFANINEFSFIKQIGVGSFGSVKLALHISTNKSYAIKVVNIGIGVSENEVLILEREINLHTRIDHPHIVKLWDTLIEGNIVYMVMELAQNGTLFAYQNKHQEIGQSQSFKYFSQTLSAVRYLHAHDIMHRDIKPQNILLDHALNVKICDFGWATDNIHLKRKTYCGTYQYMAPEVVFQKQYNSTIDIWALGILLYQLLHRYAPFKAKNIDEMKEKLKLGYYQLGSTFSKELKSLIIDILQFDSDHRPTVERISDHLWMQKMKRQIRGENGKVQSQSPVQSLNRAKVDRYKGSLLSSSTRKCQRYDSLMNQNYFKKVTQPNVSTGKPELINPVEKFLVEQKRHAKKKCKTQGEESIQKIFTQCSAKVISENKQKQKPEKENSNQMKQITQSLKSTFVFRNQDTQNAVAMKKITDKLNQMTSKYPMDRRKRRLKTQNEEIY